MCEKHSKKSKIRRKKRHFKLKKINYFTCGSIDVDKIIDYIFTTGIDSIYRLPPKFGIKTTYSRYNPPTETRINKIPFKRKTILAFTL